MKFLLLMLYVVFQYAAQTTSIKAGSRYAEIIAYLDKMYPDRWLDVPLDHFNLFDNRTFKMRYKVSDEYFEEGNPLFIEVGGEKAIHGQHLVHGQLHKLAEKHKGMLIETEHRYYGKSLPFPGIRNFSNENLKYLQIEQALEDLALFIEHFKSITVGTNNSVVVIHGCSYPGMLVTWLRLRFPHVVDIAYASSAPLGVGLDYPEYFQVINDVYANRSSKCIDTIREGFNQTEILMKTNIGRKLIRDALSNWTCGNAATMSSYQILEMYRMVLNVIYDPYHYEDVGCLAMLMNTDDTEAYERLANFIVIKSADRKICSENAQKSLKEDNEEMPVSVINRMAWSYQTCTEMGTFPTLNRSNSRHPFGVDLSLQDSLDRCRQFDGVTETVLLKGIERVTRRYGGMKPKVSKVVTVQGTHDPWKHLAVLEDYTPEAPVFVVDGSHCTDIQENTDDPDVLIELRKNIRDLISKWIEEIS